jgi:hypothetical protein
MRTFCAKLTVMGGGAEPLRNETFESMLFSSHWRSSMRRSLLRPAVPLMDLHFLRRDGVAAIPLPTRGLDPGTAAELRIPSPVLSSNTSSESDDDDFQIEVRMTA